MLDTVKIKSPELPAEILDRISEQLQTRMTVENATGNVVTEFTSGMLQGSFDHRTRVEVCTSELRVIPGKKTRNGKPELYTAPCSHIIIEGSVHKAMQGVNIQGGPDDPRASVRWYVNMISEGLGVALPDGDAWEWQRLDWAECFDLGSFEACREFLSAMRLAKFPRRNICNFGNETIGFYGTTTAWKAYHKGPEFYEHDRKRLRHVLSPDVLQVLQDLANGIIRVETSIKLKKFKADFGGKALVKEVAMEYVLRVFDLETVRVIRESEQEMNTVRQARDVRKRLQDVYGDTRGSYLYAVWNTFSSLGEEEVRSSISRPTFYRHRKLLQDAGVSWFGGDVVIATSAIPEGFSLRRSDPRRLTGESDAVRIALMPWRTVAA
jgi:II/X family phage/plasmid replication protein